MGKNSRVTIEEGTNKITPRSETILLESLPGFSKGTLVGEH